MIPRTASIILYQAVAVDAADAVDVAVAVVVGGGGVFFCCCCC